MTAPTAVKPARPFPRMPIDSWFPTHVYAEPLLTRGAERFNADLREECYRIRDFDAPGRRWCTQNYPGGYTSYASMPALHEFSSTFGELEKHIRRHVLAFARHLEFDLRQAPLAMTDCWVNIMPRQVTHGSHIHPLSVISGTYYVQTPPGAAHLKFEDPRLGFMMGAPPRRARHRPDNRQHVRYEPKAGHLILFESWLRHEVAANGSDEDRISISFNYR